MADAPDPRQRDAYQSDPGGVRTRLWHLENEDTDRDVDEQAQLGDRETDPRADPRDQRQQRHVADSKEQPGPSCTAVPLGVSLAGPPLVITSAVPPRQFRARAGSCRPVPAPWPTVPGQSSYPRANPLRKRREGQRRCLDAGGRRD